MFVLNFLCITEAVGYLHLGGSSREKDCLKSFWPSHWCSEWYNIWKMPREDKRYYISTSALTSPLSEVVINTSELFTVCCGGVLTTSMIKGGKWRMSQFHTDELNVPWRGGLPGPLVITHDKDLHSIAEMYWQRRNRERQRDHNFHLSKKLKADFGGGIARKIQVHKCRNLFD